MFRTTQPKLESLRRFLPAGRVLSGSCSAIHERGGGGSIDTVTK